MAKCACGPCTCEIPEGKGVEKDGKLYCSDACANECTDTECKCNCPCDCH